MNILFQKKAIKYETEKAFLIQTPRSKWLVWMPKSLVKQRNWYLSAFLPESMTFTLAYQEQKKSCSAKQLEIMFDGRYNIPSQEKVVTHVPPKLKPKKVKIDDSLKR